jgi:hypothetical protein
VGDKSIEPALSGLDVVTSGNIDSVLLCSDRDFNAFSKNKE